MNLTQQQYERIRSFASRINDKFVETYGQEKNFAPDLVKSTKVNCLLNGIRQEIYNVLRPNIKHRQINYLTWEQVIEGVIDAEWLKDLHQKEANRGSKPDYFDNQDDFDIDNEGFVHVYTDGACINNGTPTAQAGIGVWFGHRHRQNESLRLDPRRHPPTNIVAEIMAITEAFDVTGMMGVDRLAVHTDSMFIIDCFQQRWIHSWLSNGWMKTDGGPVENKKQFRELLSALEDFVDFKMIHVNRSHGTKGNVEADKLAKEGARKPVKY